MRGVLYSFWYWCDVFFSFFWVKFIFIFCRIFFFSCHVFFVCYAIKKNSRGGGGGDHKISGWGGNFFMEKHFFLISCFIHVLCYFLLIFERFKMPLKMPLIVCSTFRFCTNSPSLTGYGNMKLNGRWFLQIVDRDSGSLYPIYPPFPCSDFGYQGWGGGGGSVSGGSL